jgi:predicted phage-related endonuclease
MATHFLAKTYTSERMASGFAWNVGVEDCAPGTEGRFHMIPGSEEWKAWKQDRCGSLGASCLSQAIARTKTGWGASRANLMADLVVERLTGTPVEGFVSPAMLWGIEQEPNARLAYEFLTNQTVIEVGIVRHPTIAGTHASPDGLVGTDGLIEIKSPLSATHISTLLSEDIDQKYVIQIQWQLACTGRKWCDFCSFDPRLPAEMQLFTKRLLRDDVMIGSLEQQVREFLIELERQVTELRTKFLKAAA